MHRGLACLRDCLGFRLVTRSRKVLEAAYPPERWTLPDRDPTEELCSPFKKRVHDPSAPYDAYDESDDTEQQAKSGYLKPVGREGDRS